MPNDQPKYKPYLDYYAADGYFAEGNLRVALAHINKAMLCDSTEVRFYIMRARILAKLGNYSDAMNDISKSVALSPDFSSVYLVRGWIYMNNRHDFQHAAADFQKAADLGFTTCSVYSSLGMAYLESGNYTQASAAFEKASNGGDNFCSVVPWQALVYLRQKHTVPVEGVAVSFNSHISASINRVQAMDMMPQDIADDLYLIVGKLRKTNR